MTKRLAYIYDHRYYKNNNKIYSSGALSHTLWDRFLDGFDAITVFGNIIEADEEDVSNLNIANHPNVIFCDIGYMTSLKDFLYGMLSDDKNLRQTLRNFDAVIIRVPGEISFNAFRIAKKLNKPIGLEVVGCPWDAYWNFGNIKAKLLAPIAYFRMRNIVKQSTHTVYVTQNFLQYRYPTKGENINASNVEIEVPPSDIIDTKKTYLTRNKNIIRIGLIGSSNVKYKGHYEALKALSLIKNNIPNFQIEFTGPGDNHWIRKLATKLKIEDKVVFNGKLPSGKPIIDWLDGLDIYVHPSKQEGLPRSVIEAMSRACPVLASSVAGIPELISAEFLHKPGDYNKLAQDLNRVLCNNEILLSMSLSNYHKSKDYDKEILNLRRKKFWSEFAAQIN